MKKFALKTVLVALSALFAFNATAVAADPTAGKEYIEVRKAHRLKKKWWNFSHSTAPTVTILS
ncbi:Uncharacterised protein [Mannheimia haemolytica]|uniref:Uncharacterized protein n=1 Tax=Mannheimia haemolytica TaxID=75985 RepID=A0A378MXY9_MANHA|nr:Uncharacterised protein [Mannheimia haemolytica]